MDIKYFFELQGGSWEDYLLDQIIGNITRLAVDFGKYTSMSIRVASTALTNFSSSGLISNESPVDNFPA